MFTEKFSIELYNMIYNDGILNDIDIKEKLKILTFNDEYSNYISLINGLKIIGDDIETFLSEIYDKYRKKTVKDQLYYLNVLFNLIYLCYNLKKISQHIKNLEKYKDFEKKFSNSDPSVRSALENKIISESEIIRNIIRNMLNYMNSSSKLFAIGLDIIFIDALGPFLDLEILKKEGENSVKDIPLVQNISNFLDSQNSVAEYLAESYFGRLPPDGVKYVKDLFSDNQNNLLLNSVVNLVNSSLNLPTPERDREREFTEKLDYQDLLAYQDYLIENINI